jgi:histone-binding protein RBBP4
MRIYLDLLEEINCNYVWDLSQIGGIQTPDAENGVQEMLFIHGGHTSKINDLSLHPCHEMMIASVAHDNLFHVWKMSEWIYKDEDDFLYEESHGAVGDIP